LKQTYLIIPLHFTPANVLLFKSCSSIFIGFGIIKELSSLVGSGTLCSYSLDLQNLKTSNSEGTEHLFFFKSEMAKRGQPLSASEPLQINSFNCPCSHTYMNYNLIASTLTHVITNRCSSYILACNTSLP
jgi:hypothetical protein